MLGLETRWQRQFLVEVLEVAEAETQLALFAPGERRQIKRAGDAGHAEYTVGDLSALIGLPATEVVIARGTQESDARTGSPASAALDATSTISRRAAAAAAPTPPATKRRIVVRHLTPALEIVAGPDGRVAGVRSGRNLLVRNENGQVRTVTFPGAEETIPCGVVLIARR